MTLSSPRSGQEDVGPTASPTRKMPTDLGGTTAMASITDDDDDEGAELAPTSPNPAADACSPPLSPASTGCLTPSRSCGLRGASAGDSPATPASEIQADAPMCTPDQQVARQKESPASAPAPSCTYRITRLIGVGSAKVHRATVLASNIPAAPRGAQVAVKTYDTAGWKGDQFKNVRGEISSMARMHHRNIVQFHSCKYVSAVQPSPYSYASYGRPADSPVAPTIVIVQELCAQSDLFDNVKKYGAMPEDVAKHYSRELLQATAYMHAQRVAHRDLKLENIVLNGDWVLKVCDFGHAVQWADHVQVPLEFYCAGTERYRSPEVQAKAKRRTSEQGGGAVGPAATACAARATVADELNEANWYDPRLTDAWAAAVVFFEMLLGYPPMSQADPSDWYFDKIRRGRWAQFWAQHEKNCARAPAQAAKLRVPNMRAFFEAAFQPDPARRATVAQMLDHPYLRGATMADTAVADAMRRRCQW